MILLFQFDLNSIYIQLFMNRFTNLPEFFHILNQPVTLNKAFIVAASSYTVTSVDRTVFKESDLDTFRLSLEFKLKANLLYSYKTIIVFKNSSTYV